jgi:hypothetical protein
MSDFKPTLDTDTSDDSAIAGAVAVLTAAAQKNFPGVKARLKSAGFEIARYAPPQQPKPGVSGIAAIGQLIAGKGIFVGAWEPRDRGGQSLDKIFDVFAAPEDLTDSSGRRALLTFKEAAAQVASLRNWNGHDGGDFNSDTELYKALGSNTYKGEWFIPTCDLLIGTDVDGRQVRAKGLHHNKNNGALKGTFTTGASGSVNPGWYWSCTERRDYPDGVLIVRFSDGDDGWDHKDDTRLSCRPCRVEAVSHLVR